MKKGTSPVRSAPEGRKGNEERDFKTGAHTARRRHGGSGCGGVWEIYDCAARNLRLKKEGRKEESENIVREATTEELLPSLARRDVRLLLARATAQTRNQLVCKMM